MPISFGRPPSHVEQPDVEPLSTAPAEAPGLPSNLAPGAPSGASPAATALAATQPSTPVVVSRPFLAVPASVLPTPAQATLPLRSAPLRERLALPAVLLVTGGVFLTVVTWHYPLQHWLFFRYSVYWLLALLFSAACLSTGYATLRLLLPRPIPAREALVLSFAVGVYEYFLGMTAGGLLHIYSAAFFVCLPLVMVAVGLRPLVRLGRRASRHLRAARRRAITPLSSWVVWFTVFGAVGLFLVYFPILTPDNAAFDARWKHLAVAEHYVAEHGIGRFPEGWWFGATPHLAAVLYTWAFLLPQSQLFNRVELAAHLEFVIFLWTLPGISVVVRRILPRSHVPAAWAARFLFPGVLLYDSSLSVGADHIAALFAAPIFTVMLRTLPELSPRFATLLALLMASAFLTKYTGALLLLAPPIVALAVRTCTAGLAQFRRRGSLPQHRMDHWACDGARHGSPVHCSQLGQELDLVRRPVLSAVPLLPPCPPVEPRCCVPLHSLHKERPMAAPHNLKGLATTLGFQFAFSFAPNDWARYHGDAPVFGSLFTILLLALPFLRGTKRVWWIYAAAQLGVGVWYWTSHQDRYLQAIVPWMAAGTAAAMALVWRTGLPGRLGLAWVVGLQLLWGAGVYFIPGHVMVGMPAKNVIDLLGAGHRQNYAKRFQVYTGYQHIAARLRPRSKVLVHDHHVHLGIEAASVTDSPWEQGAISYGRLASRRALYDLYASLGVTHILIADGKSTGNDSIAGDLRFFQFAYEVGVERYKTDGFTLVKMPPKPPPATPDQDVAALTCGRSPRSGLYKLEDLRVPVWVSKAAQYPAPRTPGPPNGSPANELLAHAGFVLVETPCESMPAEERSAFTKVTTRGTQMELWVRNEGGASSVNREAPSPGGGSGEPDNDTP